jgi:hypothetical protein
VWTVVVSSGSTGAAKHLPVTRSSLRALRAVEDLWLKATLSDQPRAAAGAQIVLTSPPVLGPHAAGVTRGTVTGLALPRGSEDGRLVALPAAAERLADPALRRYATILHALRAELTFLTAPAPSAVLRFLDELRGWAPWLLEDLRHGTFAPPPGLDPERCAGPGLTAAPQAERAHRLTGRGELSAMAAWPGLAAVATWLDGSCALYRDRLQEALPAVALCPIGYAASEGYFSVACEATSPGSALALEHYLFELYPEHGARSDVVPLEDAEPGRRYGIVVTTRAGLYRYDMGDVLEVVGRLGAAPLLAFCHRRGGSSVAAEKLTESQLVEATRRAGARLGVSVEDVVAAPELTRRGGGRYRIEVVLSGQRARSDEGELAGAFDAALAEVSANYHMSREAGRLAGPVVTVSDASGIGRIRLERGPCGRDPDRGKRWHLVLDAWGPHLPSVPGGSRESVGTEEG